MEHFRYSEVFKFNIHKFDSFFLFVAENVGDIVGAENVGDCAKRFISTAVDGVNDAFKGVTMTVGKVGSEASNAVARKDRNEIGHASANAAESITGTVFQLFDGALVEKKCN